MWFGTGAHPGTASFLPCEHGSCWKDMLSGHPPCAPRRPSSALPKEDRPVSRDAGAYVCDLRTP